MEDRSYARPCSIFLQPKDVGPNFVREDQKYWRKSRHVERSRRIVTSFFITAYNWGALNASCFRNSCAVIR